MKTQKLNIEVLFHPFKNALGDVFAKVCNDAKSLLGRLDKDILTTGGNWKPGVKGKIMSVDKNELQLPLNNPMSSLILFAMEVQQLNRRADFGGNEYHKRGDAFALNEGIQCELPVVCKSWIKQEVSELVK